MSGKSRVKGNVTKDASYSRRGASSGSSHPQSDDSKNGESSRNTPRNSALGSAPSTGSLHSHESGRHSTATSAQRPSSSTSTASRMDSAGTSKQRERPSRTAGGPSNQCSCALRSDKRQGTPRENPRNTSQQSSGNSRSSGRETSKTNPTSSAETQSQPKSSEGKRLRNVFSSLFKIFFLRSTFFLVL